MERGSLHFDSLSLMIADGGTESFCRSNFETEATRGTALRFYTGGTRF